MKDRVALVTGAGSATGIGFACARALGRAGARLAIAATTERIHARAAELTAAGFPTVGFVGGDLVDSASADQLLQETLKIYGRLDILVNNAGMVQVGESEVKRDLADLTDAQWRRGLDISLTTAFNVTRAALPAMRRQGYGRIVMLSSVTGPIVSNPQSAFYSAAKAGMVGMARSLAIEVARQGITVNAVLPGWILTGSSSEGENVGGLHTPVGRSGRPDEVAAAVAFFASEAASYVTGTTLVVDGGNSIQEYKGPAEGYY